MSTERDPKTGRFKKKEQPMTDTTEILDEYRVTVPRFVLWPVHAVAWVLGTIVRAVVLVALVAALIAVLGWYVGAPADSCPAVQPARAIAPGSFST